MRFPTKLDKFNKCAKKEKIDYKKILFKLDGVRSIRRHN